MGWKASDIPDLTGRVAVVTGGNGGLGLATSMALAAHGATVVIGARNLPKAEAARTRILTATPGAALEVYSLDLGSLKAVDAFAGEVRAAHPVVHMLFNNAGLMAVPEGKTTDGFETQYGTNHLGHFALTLRLLPSLLAAAAASGEARVVSTSSIGRHTAGKFDVADLQLVGHYEPWKAYGISKRCVMEFAFELDRRLAARGVRGFSSEPGLAKTDLQSTAARSMRTFQHRFWEVVVRFGGQSAARGALGQLRAATDPKAVPGTLYVPRWMAFGAPVMRRAKGRMADPAEQAAVWDLAERETGITLASVLG